MGLFGRGQGWEGGGRSCLALLENPEVDPRGPGAKGVNWARTRRPPFSFEARELTLHTDAAYKRPWRRLHLLEGGSAGVRRDSCPKQAPSDWELGPFWGGILQPYPHP